MKEEQGKLSLSLPTFEGPLDLLLHLIEKNKVDIMDIPIAMIADQYMEYLDVMKERQMEILSDFLVMAATLLEIKARMLLPPETDEEGEEIDPRAELVAQLLEYKIVRYHSDELKEKEAAAEKVLFRREDMPPEVSGYREPVDMDALLSDLTLLKLGAIFAEVMKRREDRTDPERSRFGNIEKETVDAAKVRSRVAGRIMKKGRCSFRSLFEKGSGRMVMVVTFLTVLELMRTGRISAIQDDIDSDIIITAKDKSEWIDDDSAEDYA